MVAAIAEEPQSAKNNYFEPKRWDPFRVARVGRVVAVAGDGFVPPPPPTAPNLITIVRIKQPPHPHRLFERGGRISGGTYELRRILFIRHNTFAGFVCL